MSTDGHLSDGSAPLLLPAADLERLVRIARTAIAHALSGSAWRPGPDDCVGALGRSGGAFVTLHRAGHLRGCVGRMTSGAPLAVTVADVACSAALADPRFRPVGQDELDELEVSVSVLTPPAPLDVLSFDELRRTVRPGVDGLVVERGRRRATLLPAVWDDLPDVDGFLDALWRKAGLPPASWTDDTRVLVYAAQEGHER